MSTSVASGRTGRKPDKLSLMIVDAIEYLEEIGHPITVTSVKEVVLDDMGGTGPQVMWGPISVPQAIKLQVGVRARAVLIRLGYTVVDGETYERILSAKRSRQQVHECIRFLKQLGRYDENRLRYEEGIEALMSAHHVRSQDRLPEDALEALWDTIYA